MKIGIDLDSVLNDLDLKWIQWINETYDPGFTIEQWTQWDFHKHTPCGEKVFEYLELPGTFRNLPVKKGAQYAVMQLLEAGHELFVITACTANDHVGKIIQDKSDWLKEHFPTIPSKNYIYTNRKDAVAVDLLIDDGPHNIEDFPGYGIIFDAPWNRHVKEGPNVMRAAGWEEVVIRIDGNFI